MVTLTHPLSCACTGCSPVALEGWREGSPADHRGGAVQPGGWEGVALLWVWSDHAHNCPRSRLRRRSGR